MNECSTRRVRRRSVSLDGLSSTVPNQIEDKPMRDSQRVWREAVPNDRLAHLAKDAVRALTRALQDRLTERGVPYGYWTFLRILWERDGMTQRELSVLAGVKDPTTHIALQAMEKQGYIARRKLPDNMKNNRIYLTPEGRALKDQLVPLAIEVNQVALRGIPAKNVAIVRDALMTMVRNLDQDEIGSAAGARVPKKP